VPVLGLVKGALRAEWARPNERRFATLAEAQASLDAWVEEYNTVRPHQSLGGRPPAERFAVAAERLTAVDATADTSTGQPARNPVIAAGRRPAGVSRWVDQRGLISLAGSTYRAGPTYAGEHVEVVVTGGLVEILHAGVLIATHVQRVKHDQRERREPAEIAGDRCTRSRPAECASTHPRTGTRPYDGCV
jgi:hypothetical protein